MGTNLNFKSYGNDPPGDGGGGRFPANAPPLARQTSIYSLTFDELQNTMGGAGKDFGSMNMDELLKNIWTAEEIQGMASSSAAQDGGGGGGVPGPGPGPGPGGYLQRQGSLTLPRTLSTRTVDEVWKDMAKEYGVGKDGGGGGGGGGGSNRPRREPTLGEVTLEEFLVRAGVVREDIQLGGAGFFGELSRPNNTNGLQIGFQQTGRNLGLMGNLNSDGTNQISLQATNLPLNVNGVRSNQQQQPQQQVQAQAQMQQHQKQLFPKQPAVAYASQLGSPGTRGGIVGMSSPGLNGGMVQNGTLQGGGVGIVGMSSPGLNGGMVQNGTLQGGGVGMVGLGAGAVTVAANSPANQLSSDGLWKSNGDMSSVSPVPYVFNGGMRGRRGNGTVEKVVERRQRRMIKNRESAARSRARKQAYTMELEEEVAKLKEENEELKKKQEAILEMQKNQVDEMINMQRGGKKQCLRRTQTGPW